MSDMDPVLTALLPIVATAIGWGFWLAYRAGQILTAVEEKLRHLDRRVTDLERRVPQSTSLHALTPTTR